MEKPPAYNEHHFETFLPAPTLPQHLTEARTARINDIITERVLPNFQEAVTSGLSTATLVLFPSNQDASPLNECDNKGNTAAPEIIGFPSTENVSVLPLAGKENGLEFWRQLAVIRELEDVLKSRLEVSGHRIWMPVAETIIATRPNDASQRVPKKGGPFFRRKQSGPSSSNTILSPTAQVPGTSWATPSTQPLQPNEIKVDVQLKDVSTRIVTAMGLYDAVTSKGVVVKMEIGV